MSYTNVDRIRKAEWHRSSPDDELFTTEMAYDPAGRVTTIHHYDGSGTLARFDYTVDARGNRTQAVEQRQPSGGGTLQPQTHVYTNDGVERVTGATTYPNATPTGTPIRTFAYAYDLAGNRTSAALNGTPTNYTYNTRNQLTSDGTSTFSYDKNGNRISDGTLTTVWDRAGRMLSHDGHSYAYDGEGRRIAQTAAGSTTRYVLDVQRGLPAVIGAKAGSDVTHYMHGPLGMFAQRNPDTTWNWLLHDGLGSVRGVFDGTLQSAAEYDPFGEPIVAPAGTAYGFTGELTDGNGLVYLRARYLAPSLGTFASRDPWRGSASAPRTWNGYAWVEGNVVNRVDPGGMCWQNSGSSAPQREICLGAWVGYASQVDLSDARIRDLMVREHDRWARLPYADFALMWNDNSAHAPFSSDPGDELLAAGAPTLVLASQADSPLPGPADVIAVMGLVCLAGLALVAGATAIGLPTRQSVNFDLAIELLDRELDTDLPLPKLPESRRWCCDATCNVQSISNPDCPDHVFGRATGSSEEEACRAAKRVATQSTPAGCYPRHCQCDCAKC